MFSEERRKKNVEEGLALEFAHLFDETFSFDLFLLFRTSERIFFGFSMRTGKKPDDISVYAAKCMLQLMK